MFSLRFLHLESQPPIWPFWTILPNYSFFKLSKSFTLPIFAAFKIALFFTLSNFFLPVYILHRTNLRSFRLPNLKLGHYLTSFSYVYVPFDAKRQPFLTILPYNGLCKICKNDDFIMFRNPVISLMSSDSSSHLLHRTNVGWF